MRLALRMDFPRLGDTDFLPWGFPGHTGTPGGSSLGAPVPHSLEPLGRWSGVRQSLSGEAAPASASGPRES